MKKLIFIAFGTLLFSIGSCDYLNFNSEDTSNEIVASVGSKNLYKNDLLALYSVDMNSKDSAIVINNFIENWAKKQIYLQKAALNLPKEKEEALENMVSEYRDDLFINSYREALVAQNLDTIISDDTILNFYTANQAIFKLNEELIKYKYLSFNTNSMDVNKTKDLFSSDAIESVEQLLEEEFKFSVFQLNDSVWCSYSDLVKSDVFIKSLNKYSILKKNTFIQEKDSVNTHFIQVKDVLKRNEIAPLAYVKPVIKQMILHKKRLQYLKELEDKLIQEAINNNSYIKQ